MAKNLQSAKDAKNDEFYTQFEDIQREINAYIEYNPDTFRGKTVLLPCDDPDWSNFTKFFAQNFEAFGLKKLISTSYAVESKKYKSPFQLSLFEQNSPKFDPDKSKTNGKIYWLDKDKNKSNKIDINNLDFDYLNGDGDFRSSEVKKLRDEADIIVTNPPFSLFREFLAWIMEAEKQFLIIGNLNVITYKEIFPLIRENKIWLGTSGSNSDVVFKVPDYYEIAPSDRAKAEKRGYKGNYTTMRNTCWFTNLDHGRRHEPLILMSMEENLKYSRHKIIKEYGYLKYDNYDAVEVPFTDAIPNDYDGVMGVPVSFLDKYCPEQFEIVGMGTGDNAKQLGITKNYRGRTDIALTRSDGTQTCPFQRILIRKKRTAK